MKRSLKDVASYPLQVCAKAWQGFCELSLPMALKLFLLGVLVVLFFFWWSYNRKDRYDFQNCGFKARCDKVTGEVYWIFGENEAQIGVPKSDNQ